MDGDGDLDALAVNDSWHQPNRLFLNDGTGHFVEAPNQFPQALVTADLVLGDVDGDGDLDAFVGLFLLLNDGSGNFAFYPGFAFFNGSQVLSAALGDIDSDGDLDFVLGSREQNRVIRNDGTTPDGALVLSEAPLPVDRDYTTAVALGDVDGDGDLDALMGNQYAEDRLYLNDGAGNFTDGPVRLPANPERTTSIALGDIDADGDLDALLGVYGGQLPSARLYLNDGSGAFTHATGQLAEPAGWAFSFAFGDLDGDADLDVLVGHEGCWSSCQRDQNHVYFNDGAGSFTNGTSRVPQFEGGGSAVASGDVDGDGDRDLVVGSWQSGYYSGQDRLLLNDGTGHFTDGTERLPVDTDWTWDLALCDLDGDGDLDLVAANVGSNRLYLNDGAGHFTDASNRLPAHSDTSRACICVDVDGDGDHDLVFGNDNQQNRLYLNDGAGMFTDASSSLPQLSARTHALAAADLDGDGDVDLVAANRGPDRVYANDGTGNFTVSQTTPSTSSYALALGDVDGDGDQDLLTVGDSSMQRLYLNDGAGQFQDASSQLPPGMPYGRAVALGDVDGDGDLDAVIGNTGDTHVINPPDMQNQLYRNDGSGNFTDATAELPAFLDWTSALVLDDLDGDEDLDLYIAGDSNELFFNVTRQIAWRSLPRFGLPPVIDLYGGANQGWILVAALARANVVLPPLGTIGLDPQAILGFTTGTLDSDGRAAVTLPAPIDLGSGLTVHLQAVVDLAAPRLTNVETLEFQ